MSRAMMRSAVVAVYGVAVLVRLYGITNPLVDSHHQRQTQTAIVARNFYRDGIDILNPRLPLFGNREVVIRLDFPVYQAAAAEISRLIGFYEVTGRLLSVAASLVAVWLVARITSLLGVQGWGPVAAAGAMAVSPLWIYFGRAYMVDVSAHALALGAVYTGFRYKRAWPRARGVGWLVVLVGFLSMALLSKVTTAYIIAPLLVILSYGGERRRLSRVTATVVLALAAVPAMFWIFLSQTAPELSSGYSIVGIFERTAGGAVQSFTDWRSWAKISLFTLGMSVTLVGVALAAWGLYRSTATSAGRLLWVWLGALAAELLLLFSAFVGHPYYALGWAPPLAIAVGLGWSSAAPVLLAWLRQTRPVYVAGCMAVIVLGHGVGYYYFFSVLYDTKRLVPQHLASAAKIAAITDPLDVLALDDPPNVLNTTFAFYSDRRLIAFESGVSNAPERLVEAMRRDGVTVFVAIDNGYGAGAQRLQADAPVMQWLHKRGQVLIDERHLVAVRLRPQVGSLDRERR